MKYATTADAAQALCCTTSRIRQLVAEGKLHPVRLGMRDHIFEFEQIWARWKANPKPGRPRKPSNKDHTAQLIHCYGNTWWIKTTNDNPDNVHSFPTRAAAAKWARNRGYKISKEKPPD